MKDVSISKFQGDSLVSQLGSLYKAFSGSEAGEDLNFDFSSVRFVSPLLLLPISAYINSTNSSFKIDQGSDTGCYLNTVIFPKGVESVSSFLQKIQKNKNYIPISILKKDDVAARDKLEALFSEQICRVLGNISGAQNAIAYPISELVTNIFEHSEEEKGYVFSQFYPAKNYLEISIVDRGRGFSKTYEDEKGIVLSDSDSIIEAMEGHSVKDKERGFGLRTSKRVICEGLQGGGFILISGSSALVAENGRENLVELPDFYWQGAIISYRIPKPKGKIDISQYLE
ncbi:MAG: ATP-binding protein [Candidatus Paceibacterota bacterium]|jgi:anti-sigma regulatory factor (Ser/Thr protein kinase)